MIALVLACTTTDPAVEKEDSHASDSVLHESAADSEDTTTDSDPDTAPTTDPFADVLVSFSPGEGAGYGQDQLPDVVLGSPEAPGNGGGSLDVLSLGREGEIILQFTDVLLMDGPGPDLLVFENPFTGWYEPGRVAISVDGLSWYEWPCDAENAAEGYPGCAGVALVYANSSGEVDPTDPVAAGGDAFDLADLGVDFLGQPIGYVRVRDAGVNDYSGTSGGFDLDAVAVVNAG